MFIMKTFVYIHYRPDVWGPTNDMYILKINYTLLCKFRYRCVSLDMFHCRNISTHSNWMFETGSREIRDKADKSII